MTKARTFLWLATAIILTGLAWAFFTMQDGYMHERQAEDCSDAYDYPMCKRAVAPTEYSGGSSPAVYLSILGMTLAALFLTVLAFKSSIMGQEDITAPGSASTKAQKAFLEKHTPETIIDNDIPESAVEKHE